MIIWFKKVSKLPVKKCWKGYLMCLEAHWKVFYCCYDSMAQCLLTSQHNWLQLPSRSEQTVPGITLSTIWTRSLKFVNKNQIRNYFSHLWMYVALQEAWLSEGIPPKDVSSNPRGRVWTFKMSWLPPKLQRGCCQKWELVTENFRGISFLEIFTKRKTFLQKIFAQDRKYNSFAKS